MLGWINLSVQSFITDTFGADKWTEVIQRSQVVPNWVSSCPYSDKFTYDIIVAAAGLLGVSVNDALEAYGLYFIQFLSDQGYTKLLAVLGSTMADFLQNLNNLHLHLSYCWPDMIPPAFRCEQVTPESLLLHYHSSRPGLWPIVQGVLKGLSTNYFHMQLQVELLHSREKGDSDHEVFRLRYPYQEDLRNWGDASAAAQQSIYSMPASLFYTLHPFHLILDSQMQLLQWGQGVQRAVPDLQAGQQLRQHFRCKHPTHLQMDYQQIEMHTHNSFVLQARNSLFVLKGQMLPTTLQLPGSPPGPPSKVMIFLGSPRLRTLLEMQQSGIYFSDIPLHDMSSDYILLAEQRHAEADLKEKYERLTMELKAANDKLARTTAWLEEEKARAEALLYRMSGLIACFPCGPGENNPQQLQAAQAAAATAMAECQSQAKELVGGGGTGGTVDSGSGGMSRHSTALDRIEAVRRELARANIGTTEENHIQCLELLGEGTYGKVYKGLWRGSIVAVKTIVLPAMMSGQEKREKMAIMEAAISSALSHPNIMQTYTYDIKPIKDNSRNSENHGQLLLIGSTHAGTTTNTAMTGAESTTNVHSYEVRLLCEYCDRGSLREALDLGAFALPDGGINYPAVLDTAVEIATAVNHLHHRNVLHSDLKARNIMLKSSGSEGRGVTAKVADFGLAVKMDHMETHLSNAFQGTMTHMAPEIMIKGHISKAADVYALGMVLWELYTGKHVFRGIPRALLGHQITLLNRRPEFPGDAPEDYVKLTAQCWDPNPANRPKLETLLEKLQAMRAALRVPTQPLAPYDIDALLIRKHSMQQQSPAPSSKHAKKQGRSRRGSGLTAASAAAKSSAAGGSAVISRSQQQQGARARQGPKSIGSSPPDAKSRGCAAAGADDSSPMRSSRPSGAVHGVSEGAGASSGFARTCSWQEMGSADDDEEEEDGSEDSHLLERERSIYLEHSESTGGDWKGVMMMQELSVDTIAMQHDEAGGPGALWQLGDAALQRQQQQQGQLSEEAVANDGADFRIEQHGPARPAERGLGLGGAGRCPLGHGGAGGTAAASTAFAVNGVAGQQQHKQ